MSYNTEHYREMNRAEVDVMGTILRVVFNELAPSGTWSGYIVTKRCQQQETPTTD
jgi:hypothetical protein